MISSVTLKNYKAHRDTTVELGRFTVLVGPNGSGKTSVLDAIDRTELLRLHYGLDPQRGASLVFPNKEGRPRAYHRNGSGPCEISFSMIQGGTVAKRTLQWSNEPGRWTWESEGVDPSGASPFGAVTFFRFESRLIASPSESREERPFLERDGRNTADVLAALKLADDPALLRIQTTLREVVPGAKRILIQRREIGDLAMIRAPGARAVVGQQIVLDFDNAPDISAEDLSEGTLMTLALLTAVCSGPRPHTLLLDDLGVSLHPTAQMELMRQLHRLLAEVPDIQIVATTHSPYILDEMKPEDVVVLAPRDDGSIASKRLSEHPDAKMSGYLTTGELWGLGSETTWVL